MAHRVTFRALLVALTGITVIAAGGGSLASSGQADEARALAGSPYEEVAARLLERGLLELGAWQSLEKILSVGARPTGSPEADEAVALVAGHMKALGFDNVRTEPTTVPRWVRGHVEDGAIVSRVFGRIPVKVRAIGQSVRTPAEGTKARLVEVRSIEELKKAGATARGRIVFFNGRMDPTSLDTFRAYSAAAQQRSAGAIAAARAGAIGAVVRSLTVRLDDDPRTGTMSYDMAVPKIPAATISTEAAERLSQVLKEDPDAEFYFKTSCETLPPVKSSNVMGELRGIEKPEEVVLVGGHLDSWDLSPGAHDDGAGCAQSIEALRLIKALGLKPRRTIRAVLFMDEENGGTGGRDYARSVNRSRERHVAAIESDRGGFLPLGIGVGATGESYDRIKAWEPLFQKIGLQWIRPGGGGVDIGPLGASGTVLMSLAPDSQRYFDVHHSSSDTIDKVHPRELEIGASALALIAYLVSQEGLAR